jgi:hypothetical protein
MVRGSKAVARPLGDCALPEDGCASGTEFAAPPVGSRFPYFDLISISMLRPYFDLISLSMLRWGI